jgi:hypothetical protein
MCSQRWVPVDESKTPITRLQDRSVVERVTIRADPVPIEVRIMQNAIFPSRLHLMALQTDSPTLRRTIRLRLR